MSDLIIALIEYEWNAAQELQWLPKHAARRVYVLSLVDVAGPVTDCSDNVNSQTLGGCLDRSP